MVREKIRKACPIYTFPSSLIILSIYKGLKTEKKSNSQGKITHRKIEVQRQLMKTDTIGP